MKHLSLGNFRKSAAFAMGLISIALGAQGCGGSGSGAPGIAPAPGGLICSNGICSQSVTSQEKARFFDCLGPSMLVNGIPVCRSHLKFSYTIPAEPFPTLSLKGTNVTPWQTPIRLFAGDVVVIRGKGNQGIHTSAWKSLLGLGCDGPDVTGRDSDGNLINAADGEPAGLYGALQTSTSRSAAFLIGSKYGLPQVATDAELLVGFNAPEFELQANVGMCVEANTSVSVDIIRCVDASGNSYHCPR